MTNGKIEPQDADTLMGIYTKISIDGYTIRPLTPSEQTLIFCLSQAISEGKIINAEDDNGGTGFPYIIGQAAEIFHEGKWCKGKIINGYRFHDGIVTIETEDGQKIWCGEAQTYLYRPLKE